MVATVQELAALVGGRLIGDGAVLIERARPVTEAGAGDITFIDDERYLKTWRASPASASIVGPHLRSLVEVAPSGSPLIEVADARAAFVAVRSHLLGSGAGRWSGVHPMSYVAPSATIGVDVAIHAFASIGEHAVIGDGATIESGSVVGAHCRLGREVHLHAHVVLYDHVSLGDRVRVHSGTVLGGDGFGYRFVNGKHEKIPQTGSVVIGDDVEIGSNCAIDRGTFEATSVGAGSKIDNLVMIGHNNRIGRHNLLCGQVGIAGSCKTGDYVVMAGQVGIKDHTQIGEKVIVGAQAGVHRNIPDGQHVLGSPAIPVREQRRLFQLIARLPELYDRLKELAAAVERLSRPAAEKEAGGSGQ